MLDPRDLYELDPDLPELIKPVLVHALPGFVDAGSAGRMLGRHLLDTLPNRPLATFDVDQLVDHRSHRPTMTFVEDHWDSYTPHSLAVHLMHDEVSEPFLLLIGPEPDYQWHRFVSAMEQLIERFDVRLTVGINAIPMAVPHTRPIGLTAHASRQELIAGYEPWLSTIQVPGSVGALLEFRLGQAGADAAGFAVHRPRTTWPNRSTPTLPRRCWTQSPGPPGWCCPVRNCTPPRRRPGTASTNRWADPTRSPPSSGPWRSSTTAWWARAGSSRC